MGKRLASQAHWGVAKRNLLARMWSPMWRVFRMEAEGMVNCCPTKVLKNVMSTTAKRTISRLSLMNPLAAPPGKAFSLSMIVPP